MLLLWTTGSLFGSSCPIALLLLCTAPLGFGHPASQQSVRSAADFKTSGSTSSSFKAVFPCKLKANREDQVSLTPFLSGPGARLFGPAYQKGSILPHRHPRHSDFRLISDLEPDKEAKDSIFRNTHHNTFMLGHRSSSSRVAPGFPGSRETDFCCCSPFLAP